MFTILSLELEQGRAVNNVFATSYFPEILLAPSAVVTQL